MGFKIHKTLFSTIMTDWALTMIIVSFIDKPLDARTEMPVAEESAQVVKEVVKEVVKVKLKEELMIERIQKSQHFTSIKAIEFDWIFNREQGSAFVKTLTRSRNVDLFSIPLIQNCIQFLWDRFRTAIFLYLFFPFLLYLALFILYATWVQHRSKQEGSDSKSDFETANIAMVIGILVF